MRTIRIASASVVACLMVLTAMTSAGASTGVQQQSFASCDEAAAAGFADMMTGEPGYSKALDKDGDGVACETSAEAAPTAPAAEIVPNDEPAMTAAPAPAPPAAAPAPPAAVPAPEVLGNTVTNQAPPGELASTGISSWVLVLVALALVLMGRQLLSAGYERLNWTTGRKHSEVRFTVDSRRKIKR